MATAVTLAPANANDVILDERRDLKKIAEATLLTGKMLMEAGVSAKEVHEDCSRVARGLGAEQANVRSGYASLEITLSKGTVTITSMAEVSNLGVNHRLGRAVRELAGRIPRARMTPAEALVEIDRLKQTTGRHAPWVVALAVGMACAAFGRLLGMDWAAFIPVATGGAIGQSVRHLLLRRGINIFLVAGCVSFLASSLGRLGAQWAGSTTLSLAMTASVLLLVPGVPGLNAQHDILEGHPTLGTARAVVVGMTLIFIAVGVLLAGATLGVRQ
jgi:uncharacterized membrane protein YjjP (DUF1212 family)